MTEKIIITEINETVLPKLKTFKKNAVCLETLEFLQHKKHETNKDDYQKFIPVIRKDLSSVCGLLHLLCDVNPCKRLEAEVEFRIIFV